MKKFIRIDKKGQWFGNDHISRIANTGEDFDCEIEFEKGISCYNANIEGIEELFTYWTDYASIDDYEDYQLTIFEGEEIGTGACGEEIAICKETLVEKGCAEFFNTIYDLKDAVEYDDMEQDEYVEKMLELIK